MEEQDSIAVRKATLSGLLSFYGPLLTQTQRSMTGLFADEDYSFTEIGEVCGVSRQSAFDTVSKAEKQMAVFEERLHLLSSYREEQQALGRCVTLTDPGNHLPPEKALSEIRKILLALLDKEDQ